MRWAVAASLLLLAAGCGGGGDKQSDATVLYGSDDWQVVLNTNGAKPVAQLLHHVGDKTVVEHGVRIEILGPKPDEFSESNPPQVAITMRSKTPLVESALWVDGSRLIEKGGGSPTNGTIYGAPLQLSAGTHTAVGYARTATTGDAVAWQFRVGP